MLRMTIGTAIAGLVLAVFQISPAQAADVPCKAGKSKRTNSKGVLTSCVLTRNATFGDYTCARRKIASFFSDGTLRGCYLAKPVVINGISCKDGLSLRRGGELRRCRITEPASVGGVKDIPARSWLSFYKGGALRRVEVAKPLDMKGYNCKGYFNYFHKNGQLMKCKLAEARKIGKVQHKAGALVCWDDKGKPVADCKTLSRELLN